MKVKIKKKKPTQLSTLNHTHDTALYLYGASSAEREGTTMSRRGRAASEGRGRRCNRAAGRRAENAAILFAVAKLTTRSSA